VAEQRRMDCQIRCDLEMEFGQLRWGDPALLYDEETNLSRFNDGCFTNSRFVFSREHADWVLLMKGL
jgi:hypothetical protein